MKLLFLTLIGVSLLPAQNTEAQLRTLLQAKTGKVTLPAGITEIAREIVLPPDAHDLDIAGHSTTLKAAATFRGRALIVMTGGKNIHLHDLSIDGDRDNTGRMAVLPPYGSPVLRTVGSNGIAAENVMGLEIGQIQVMHVGGFAVLVAASHTVLLHDIQIVQSGGFNPTRRNNGTGGIMLDTGVTDFEIRACQFGGIRGNGVTVRGGNHGHISDNEFVVLARDAIEATEAGALTIENNHARQIGAPTEEVEGRAECMKLERVTESTIAGNTCEETILGAIVLSGTKNKITGNRLLRINLAQKTEFGITLEPGSTGNTVEGNEVSGSGMGNRCVASAKGANTIAKNDCSDEASVARLLPATPR